MNNSLICIFSRREALTLVFKRFRKPPWIAPSPSKIFRIPKPRPIEPELKAEMDKRFSNYNAQMTALSEVIKANVKQSAETTEATHVRQERDAIDAEAARAKERLELNKAWNAEIAHERTIWMSEKDISERQSRVKSKVDKEVRERVDQTIVDEFITGLEGESQKIISRENVEAAIEAALDNVVDYNFAIDSNGNVYKHGEIVSNMLLPDQQQQQQLNAATTSQ